MLPGSRTLATCLAAATLSWPAQVTARAESVVQYSKAQAYNSALRYLRVDLGYNVTEKDPDAAYLMFDFPRNDQKKMSLGAIEIVDTGEAVKVFVRLSDLPEYQERVLADGLLAKLRGEHGDPPGRKAPDPDPPGEAPQGANGKPKAGAKTKPTH